MSDETPKRRGRPPGRRNKPALVRPEDEARLTPPSMDSGADYRHADPETLIARQFSMLDWAQQAHRNEMMRAYQARGVSIDVKDITKLEMLSNAIVRAVDALKKSSDLAEELSARLTPEQLLEAAAKKIEAQDAATIRYYIRRLRAYLERIDGKQTGNRASQVGDANNLAGYNGRAAAAVADLEKDDE